MRVSRLPAALAYKLIRRGCSPMLWPRGGHVPLQTKARWAIKPGRALDTRGVKKVGKDRWGTRSLGPWDRWGTGRGVQEENVALCVISPRLSLNACISHACQNSGPPSRVSTSCYFHAFLLFLFHAALPRGNQTPSSDCFRSLLLQALRARISNFKSNDGPIELNLNRMSGCE
eukprot:COSAG06_NODE_9402_length_1910_cov_2.049696_2_plen_173_part_00